jgi:glycosyltransferase involved in cell wall biosynthesis
MERCDVSVVISTYNRCDALAAAVESVASQDAGGVTYEMILVDNNSTDGTRDAAAALTARHPGLLRYVFEPRQGLSYGRNAGIAAARGRIIALTDDDVRVAGDWVARIVAVLDANPHVDYLGGKVLPRWTTAPPPWLVGHHWSPLALQDYAGEHIESSADRPVCFVGANLAFRREVFDRVGLFNPRLQRVKDGIGSTEDHELQLRVWRAGMRGLYAPDVIVTAEVTPDRLTKRYHRRWHLGHGRYCAVMRIHENIQYGHGPLGRPADLVTLFGSPGFLYGQVLTGGWKWLMASVRGPGWRPLFEENRVRHAIGYITTRFRSWRAEDATSIPGELAKFVRAMVRKKVRRQPAPLTSARSSSRP